MRKILLLLLVTLISAALSYKMAYAVFVDSVGIALGISTAKSDEEPGDSLTIIENKPLEALNFTPGEWSDYGLLKLTNKTGNPVNFYMYVTKTDGNICPYANIQIQIGPNENGPWTTVYEDELELIRGNNDRVALTINEDFSKSELYVRQRIQLDAEATKNEAGRNCLWDEVFLFENKPRNFKEEHIIARSILNAGFWIPPIVEVKDPNSTKTYETSESMSIKWKAKSHTHDKEDLMRIDIDLYDESGTNFVMNIAESEENDSQFKWQIPPGIIGDTFRIKIFAEDGNGLNNEDMSDKDFRIVEKK